MVQNHGRVVIGLLVLACGAGCSSNSEEKQDAYDIYVGNTAPAPWERKEKIRKIVGLDVKWRALHTKIGQGSPTCRSVLAIGTVAVCRNDESDMLVVNVRAAQFGPGPSGAERAYFCLLEGHYYYRFTSGSGDSWLGPFVPYQILD